MPIPGRSLSSITPSATTVARGRVEQLLEVVDALVEREVLDDEPVRDRRRELRMQVVVPVRRDRHAERGRGVRGLDPLGHAAADGRVGLVDVGGARAQELAEAPCGRLDLARRDRDRPARRELRVAVDVVGQERLLEPPDVVRSEGVGRLDRLGDAAVGVVGVEREPPGGPSASRAAATRASSSRSETPPTFILKSEKPRARCRATSSRMFCTASPGR